MKRALSPTFVLLFLSLACISSSSAMDVVRGQLARDLNSYLVKEAETSFSGVVLIAKGGEVILHRAYGQSDVEKPRANSVDTVFDIGSVSQIFTAITILRLEEAGALSTSDPITRFLPAVPEDKRRITIHHLLSHSSGLPNQHAENEFQMMNLRQAGDRILQAELAFGPWSGVRVLEHCLHFAGCPRRDDSWEAFPGLREGGRLGACGDEEYRIQR